MAAGIHGSRIVPFSASSWVETLVVIGLPLIGLIALYRGEDSQRESRRVSVLPLGPIDAGPADAGTPASPNPPFASYSASVAPAAWGSTRGDETPSTEDDPRIAEGGKNAIQVRKDVVVTREGDQDAEPRPPFL